MPISEIEPPELTINSGSDRPAGLELKTGPQKLLEDLKGEELQTSALITGTFTEKDASLVVSWGDRREVLKPAPEPFSIEIRITAQPVIIDLTVIDPYGVKHITLATLAFPRWAELIERRRVQRSRSPYSINAGANFTFLSYTQTARADYSGTAVTGKASITRRIMSDRIELAGSFFLTLFPVTRTSSITARFLGLNLRAGYPLPWLKEPWHLTVFGGAYYTTMSVTRGAFGFRNLAGPQIFPAVRRTLNNGDALAGYMKFSPITDGVVPLALSNHELAGGAAYLHALPNGHSLNLTLDLSTFFIAIKSSNIHFTTTSIGAGYGF